MSHEKSIQDAKVTPAPNHWAADKPAKKIIRSANGESQDEDRHNEIRHENPQKNEG